MRLPSARIFAALACAGVALVMVEGASGRPDETEGSSLVLPRPEPPARHETSLSAEDSKPTFRRPVRAPAGAPNVLLVLLDDVGYGQAGTFGGPVPTPTLDRLAARGLRYTRFHTTALCSPTRAALLSGRNHHDVGAGVITELATGFDGYDAVWPKSAASVAEVLRQNGYGTSAFGKWHNTPTPEVTPLGPFDRWPLGQGFEHFYGFMGGETDQFHPMLYRDLSPITPPATPEAGYHLTTDLADQAIAWLALQHTLTPEKPFFLYFAPGACHAPHQAPRAWIDRFKGQFDQGWDVLREETFARQKKLGVVPADAKLTPRPAEIPAWDSFSPDERRLFARMMEVFAGFLAHTDHEVGRVVDAVERLGVSDDTLVLFIVGDNGASGEGTLRGTLNEIKVLNGVPEDGKAALAVIDELGGPLHHNHYPTGWAWAGDTPFQWMKQVASHFGGTRNPLVVSWPRRIKDRGGVRAQFHHVIDVLPTILDVAGIAAPAVVNGVPQKPFDGVSMAYTFADAGAASRRRTQYFEMFANRALYHDGWIAAARHGVPWDMAPSSRFQDDRWELYHVDRDFSEANDLAAKEPARLRELQDMFWAEAAKHDVLPLDPRKAARLDPRLRKGPLDGRGTVTFYPGVVRVPEAIAPNVKGRAHRITVECEVPGPETEGVLVTCGSRTGGYALLVQSGKLVYVYNYFGEERTTIASREPVPTGKVTLGFEFVPDNPTPGAGGLGRVSIDGRPVGEARIERTVPYLFGLEATLCVGVDMGTPVSPTYSPPFEFTGTIRSVRFDIAEPGSPLPPVGPRKD
ncbi:MAG TPA: arylsulfatase [Planctomycetota bacterium]|nr:arylsulfatase [Planctomycetota bacterium]